MASVKSDPSTASVPTPTRTIVGGQPSHEAKWRQPAVPVGVERVLYLAATNARFRRSLAADRAGTLDQSAVTLRPSERAMLLAIPDAQLSATIDGVDTSAPNLERRSFFRAVAASAVTIAAGEALLGCSDEDKDKKTDKGVVPPDHSITLDGATMRDWRPDPDTVPVPDFAITMDGATMRDMPQPDRPKPDAGPDTVPVPDHRFTVDGVMSDMPRPDIAAGKDNAPPDK